MRVRLARLSYRADQDVWSVSFPYDEDLIADLKAEIPSHARHWVASDRVWLVEPRYIDRARNVLVAHGLTIRESTDRPGPSSDAGPAGAGRASDGSGVYWQEQYEAERKLREQAQVGLVAKTRELAETRRRMAVVQAELLMAQRNGRPRPTNGHAGNWAEAMRAALPADLQDKAFKALLRVLHPDTGGSTELAKDLNGAFRK